MQILFIIGCGHWPVRIKNLANHLSGTKIRYFPSYSCTLERMGGLIIFIQFISVLGHMRKKIAKTLQTLAIRLGGICVEL